MFITMVILISLFWILGLLIIGCLLFSDYFQTLIGVHTLEIPKLISYEDIKKQWAKEEVYDLKHPVKAFFKRQYITIRAFIYNLPDAPRDAYRKVKRGVQRAYRGWADEDVWNLFGYHAKITYGMLLNLKNTHMGIPATMNPDTGEYDNDEKRWEQILDKMIYAYKLNIDIANGERELFNPHMPKKLQKEYNCLTQKEDMDRRLGMLAFNHYYFSLWD